MALKALFFNCTLKKSDSKEPSNTQALIDQACKFFKERQVECESVRVADYQVKYGTTSNEGEGDDWPKLLSKIAKADIFIMATPVWRGDRSAIAKVVAERMDGVWDDAEGELGQYMPYNKVGGVLVDGNEDGAKTCISRICFDMLEHGFTLPPNNHAYWVGIAGPGPSYIAAGGHKHQFTNRQLLYMAENMVHTASLLKKNPIPSNLNKLSKQAEEVSQ
jgi:multimeric flavodoxin WrbA